MKLPYVAVSALLALVVACESGSTAVERPPPSRAIARLPEQILGLKVVEENVATEIRGVSGTYVDSLGLFSFREENDLLRATVQVGRFNDVAEPKKQRFRNAIVAQLGSTVPAQLKVGDRIIYLTTGSEQSIFSWFDDVGFYVLSVRSDYAFPRSLLRKLVETQLIA
ncbi:MAG: hypothetical protein ACRDKJ_09670 [Actinomycetota bacterium]